MDIIIAMSKLKCKLYTAIIKQYHRIPIIPFDGNVSY